MDCKYRILLYYYNIYCLCFIISCYCFFVLFRRQLLTEQDKESHARRLKFNAVVGAASPAGNPKNALLQSSSARKSRSTYVAPGKSFVATDDAQAEVGAEEEDAAVQHEHQKEAAASEGAAGSEPLAKSSSQRAPKDIHQELIFRALDETG